MRLVGTVLLIVGVFLCISIVWAAIGFMAMLFGLICLVIVEEKAKRARKLASSSALKTEAWITLTAKAQAKHLASKIQQSKNQSKTAAYTTQALDQPSVSPPISPPVLSGLPAASDGPTQTPEQRLIWKALCAKDPDIAHGVAMLAPYAKQYLDDFAKGLFNDQKFLPLILKKIVASARQDFGLETITEPEFEMPAARPVAEPAGQKLHAKPDPVLRVVTRDEPNAPATPPKVAPAPNFISIDRGRLVEGDPPDREIHETDLQQSAVVSQMDMRNEPAAPAAQPSVAAAADANDDLLDELRRLKATSKTAAAKTTTTKNATAKTVTTKATTAKTAAPSPRQHDSGLRAVPSPEAGATLQKVVASSPAIKDDRQLEGAPAAQQIEQKTRESVAIKSVDGVAKKTLLIVEQDDADYFRFQLGKLG